MHTVQVLEPPTQDTISAPDTVEFVQSPVVIPADFLWVADILIQAHGERRLTARPNHSIIQLPTIYPLDR